MSSTVRERVGDFVGSVQPPGQATGESVQVKALCNHKAESVEC
jgi:hypothetical protein